MPDHIPSAEEAREALDKADAMVHALCHGERRWTMRVPARPDDDPDLFIGAGLYAARARLAALEADARELDRALRGVVGVLEMPVRPQRDVTLAKNAELPVAYRAIHNHATLDAARTQEDRDRPLAAREEENAVPTCAWDEDPDGVWHTQCGNAITFIEGGPSQNGQAFCGYCGRVLIMCEVGR